MRDSSNSKPSRPGLADRASVALSAGTEAAAKAHGTVAFCLTIRAILLNSTSGRGHRRDPFDLRDRLGRELINQARGYAGDAYWL